jgi:hypothetical protein
MEKIDKTKQPILQGTHTPNQDDEIQSKLENFLAFGLAIAVVVIVLVALTASIIYANETHNFLPKE